MDGDIRGQPKEADRRASNQLGAIVHVPALGTFALSKLLVFGFDREKEIHDTQYRALKE
jgi:hypothetical protein